MWFRLHPKKEDNSGWWYYKSIVGLNTKYSIHSSGKKSMNEKGLVVDDNICWSKMTEIIKQTDKFEIIKAEKFHFKRTFILILEVGGRKTDIHPMREPKIKDSVFSASCCCFYSPMGHSLSLPYEHREK